MRVAGGFCQKFPGDSTGTVDEDVSKEEENRTEGKNAGGNGPELYQGGFGFHLTYPPLPVSFSAVQK